MHTMWIVPLFGSEVKCGDIEAAPGAQFVAEFVNGGGEPTGVDGLLL